MYRSSTKSKDFKGKIKNKRHKIKKLSNKTDVFKKDYFCNLPDEIILKIFSRIPQYMLMRYCTMVCKRWNKLSKDFSLWRKVNYERRTMRVTHVRKLFELQVEELDLSKTILKNYFPLFLAPLKRTYHVQRFSRLQYLHLNGFSLLRNRDNIMKHNQYISEFTADILSICACLKVLKLQGIYLNPTIFLQISLNKGLKELHWISCTIKITLENYIPKIFQRCKELEIVDFSYTYFPNEYMSSTINNLQSSLSSLTLFLTQSQTWIENWKIIDRCPNITYLKIACQSFAYYEILELMVNSLPMLKTCDLSQFGHQPINTSYLLFFKKAYQLNELILSNKNMFDLTFLQNNLKGVKISFSESF